MRNPQSDSEETIAMAKIAATKGRPGNNLEDDFITQTYYSLAIA